MSTSNKRMKELMTAFETHFPDWAANVEAYRPFQRDAIIILFNGGKSRIFFYKSPEDWSFGTKLYRARPDRKKLKNKEEK